MESCIHSSGSSVRSVSLQPVRIMRQSTSLKQAAGALESAVALNPNDAHTHLKLAQQYQKLGRELDFEREFQKFNELSAAMARAKAAADAPDGSQPEGEAPGAASSP